MASTSIKKTGVDPTTSTQKATWSFWVKMANIRYDGNDYFLFSSYSDANSRMHIKIDGSGCLDINERISSSVSINLITTRKLRDTFGWYNIVVAIDTTQSTEADRVKVYINGTQETLFSNNTYPSVNEDIHALQGNITHYVGCYGGNVNSDSYCFDGYMSHLHFTDGYCYDASTFGSTDSTTGEWKIKTTPTVTYGNNGWFILKDGNSLTNQAGNSAGNFAVDTGTLTKSEDNPSHCFATWNPIATDNGNYATTNGGLSFSNGDNNWQHGGLISTIGIPTSGKYYWEHKKTYGGSHIIFGLIPEVQAYRCYRNSGTDIYEKINGVQCDNSSNSGLYLQESSDTGSIGAVANGDILQCAYDADNRKLWYGINGTWQNSGDPANGTNETIGSAEFTAGEVYFPFVQSHSATGTASADTNFGNGYFGTTAISSEGTNASGHGKFEYDVPTGFTALSTKGLNE